MDRVRLTDYSRRVVAGWGFNVFRDEADRTLYHVFSTERAPRKLGTIRRERITKNVPIGTTGLSFDPETSLWNAAYTLAHI